MSGEWKVLKCNFCGNVEKITQTKNKRFCPYCRTTQEWVEHISEDEIIRLTIAREDRINLFFDDAQDKYDQILKDYPKSAEAAWGAFVCSYGVKYEKDYNGTLKPTCHRLNECPVSQSPYFSKLSNTNKQQALTIETLRQKILAQAKSIPPYDVFICYKATTDYYEKKIPTPESQWARDVYYMLTRMGLKVFFAEQCLSKSNTDYEPHIYSALQSAKLMFVLGSNPEHFKSVWVQNEWRRYEKYIREGKNKTIRVIYSGFDAYQLPQRLQSKQAINQNSMNWGQQVMSAANAIFQKKSALQSQTDKELALVRKQIQEIQEQQKAQISQSTRTAIPTAQEKAEVLEKQQEEPQTPESLYNQAIACANKQNYGQAVPYFKKAADLGHKIAQCTLGYYYETGKGVEKNLKTAFEYYQKSAIQNHTTAQFNLALCHEFGKGTEKDLTMALAWYKKAESNGYKKATEQIKQVQSKLAPPQKSKTETAQDFYQKAIICHQQNDFEKAFEYFEKSSILGNKNAQCFLGFYYETGKGAKQDLAKAFSWYEQAAKQEYARAQFNLGLCYQNGKGISKDLNKALFWYEKAYKKGHEKSKEQIEKIKKLLSAPPAPIQQPKQQQNVSVEPIKKETPEELLKKAHTFHDQNDYKNSFIYYQKAAEQGLLEAQFYLAVSYEKGYGVTQSDKKAFGLYEQVAKHGNTNAQFKLGVYYQNGKGVNQNYEKANYWFTQAANQGHPSAQNNLGSNYFHGYGVKKDYKQSAYLYQQAAENGNLLAQKNLAFMYYDGSGVVQNHEKALFWFNEAAKQGDSESMQKVIELQNYFDNSAKKSKQLDSKENFLRIRERTIKEQESDLRIQEILLNNLYAKERRSHSKLYRKAAKAHKVPNSGIYGPRTENYENIKKSRAVAVLLYFLISPIGDFYLGFIGKGLFKIAICFTGIGILVNMIWGFKQALNLLSGYTEYDAKGRLID